MTYSEKLKDPRWQKKRLEILNRDNFTCIYCGDNKSTLHVHHLMYLGDNPWETPNECLDTTCKDCHDFFHVEVKKLSPLEKFFLQGKLYSDPATFSFLKKTIRLYLNGKYDFSDILTI